MKSLRSKVIRLAHAKPHLRSALLPLVRIASLGWVDAVRGENLDKIWDMYERTYRKIGLSKASKSELVTDYDSWEVFPGVDGSPIGFVLSKTTPMGKKLGLAGSDGSPEGKAALIQYLSHNFKRPGYYAEVSHAVEAIAMRSNPPVVCAVEAPMVLKKDVKPQEDGIHYIRSLSGVGQVEKVLIGRPRGISTTSASNPSCPMGVESPRFASEEDPSDLDLHLACQIDFS